MYCSVRPARAEWKQKRNGTKRNDTARHTAWTGELERVQVSEGMERDALIDEEVLGREKLRRIWGGRADFLPPARIILFLKFGFGS
jgi:hypothetical protein